MTVPTLTRRGYELDGQILPRVSAILALVHKESLWRWKLKNPQAAQAKSDTATQFGQGVHSACEQHNRGHRPVMAPWAPAVLVFADAYAAWFDANVNEVVACEQVVWSPTLRYGGTLDMLVRLRDGRLILADIKTSKTLDGMYRVQCSAYALALAEVYGIHVDGRMVVNLPSDRPGVCRVVEYDDDARDALTWRSLVWLYHWWQDHREDWRNGHDQA